MTATSTTCAGSRVWWLDLAQAGDLGLLSDAERERAARFRADRDRDRFVSRRTHVRTVLAEVVDRPPGSLRFHAGSHGKPVLVDHRHVHFSASSSGDVGVVAVAAVDVGVDVERVVATDDLGAVAARFFAEDELSQLRDVGDFFRCWTRKEAYVKAIGRGLSYPLDSFAVEVADVTAPRLLRSSLRPADVGTVRIRDLGSQADGCAAALVTIRPAPPTGAPAPGVPERGSIP